MSDRINGRYKQLGVRFNQVEMQKLMANTTNLAGFIRMAVMKYIEQCQTIIGEELK